MKPIILIALAALGLGAKDPAAAAPPEPGAAQSAPVPAASLTTPSAPGMLAEGGRPSQLDRWLEEARRANPGLQASRAEVEAARSSEARARAWMPPEVGIEFMETPRSSFPNAFAAEEIEYSVSQMIPFPGKRRAMAEPERIRARMAGEEARVREIGVERAIQEAYYELYVMDRELEINGRNRELLESVVQTALRQYESGMGTQAEILRGQSELSRLTYERQRIQRARKAMEAMVNANLGRPADSALEPVAEVVPEPVDWTLRDLEPHLDRTQPRLAAMRSEAEMQRAMVDAANQELLPDFMVRGAYSQMHMGEDAWSVMVGVTVPIAPWSRGMAGGEAARSRALARKADLETNEMRNMLAAEIQGALQEAKSGWEQAELSRTTLVPQTRQTLEASLSAYRNGRTPFLMVVDAYRMALMAELDYHMATAKLMQSRARLEEALGTSLSSLPAPSVPAAPTTSRSAPEGADAPTPPTAPDAARPSTGDGK